MASKSIQEQITALEAEIAKPENKKLIPDMELKLETLKEQLVAESTGSKEPAKPAAPQLQLTEGNPFAAKIAQTQQSLATGGKALDAVTRGKLEGKLTEYITSAKKWEKEQKKPDFKTSAELLQQSNKNKPVKPSQNKQEPPDDDIHYENPIEVGIDGKMYKVNKQLFIDWHATNYPTSE